MSDSATRGKGSPHICFGYKTALQLMRSIEFRTLPQAKNERRALPGRALGKREVEEAIQRIERTFPGVTIKRPVHILVGSAARCRPSDTCIAHMCTSHLVGNSFYRIAEGIYVSAPALSFVHQATQESNLVSLLELGYELCGTYRTHLTGSFPQYNVEPLVSVRELSGFVSKNPSINGTRKAAQAIRYLADNSASPRETKQALVFGLPMNRGGYGTGIPLMNYKVPATAAARALSGRTSFRCDLCWPEYRLDVEYQSREHHGGEASRISDSRRTNALMSMDWTVIGITNDELDSLAATDAIAQTIRRHLGKRPQVSTADAFAKKLKLRRQLGLPTGAGRILSPSARSVPAC